MRKIMMTTLLALFALLTVNAQATKKDTGNGPLKERVSNFWKKTKKSLDKAAEKIENDFTLESSGLRRISGKYYMNIYDTNLYKGEDGESLRSLCLKEFSGKYPHVKVHSCVIPQSEWLTETVEANGEVTGYAQTLYCYILGKDGNEGFINAKFVFERQKKVGEPYINTRVKWPLWLRTDVMTNDVAERLMMNK